MVCSAYGPLRLLPHGLGTTRSIRTVNTGTEPSLPEVGKSNKD